MNQVLKKSRAPKDQRLNVNYKVFKNDKFEIEHNLDDVEISINKIAKKHIGFINKAIKSSYDLNNNADIRERLYSLKKEIEKTIKTPLKQPRRSI